jgi:hypothetical protein
LLNKALARSVQAAHLLVCHVCIHDH